MPEEFTVSDLSRLSRKTDRGSHDREAIYDILDASIVCHVAYVANGQAFATQRRGFGRRCGTINCIV